MQVSLRGRSNVCCHVTLWNLFLSCQLKTPFFFFFFTEKQFNVLLLSSKYICSREPLDYMFVDADFLILMPQWPCNNSYLWHIVSTVPLLRNPGYSETIQSYTFKPKLRNGSGVSHPWGRLTQLVKRKMKSGLIFNEKTCSKGFSLRSEKKIGVIHSDSDEVTLLLLSRIHFLPLVWVQKNGSHNTQVSLVCGWIVDGWAAATGGGTHAWGWQQADGFVFSFAGLQVSNPAMFGPNHRQRRY